MLRILAVLILLPQAAQASDFWDEIRTPGIARYRQLVEEAELAVRARRLSDAERIATEALELVDDDARAYVFRGVARGERGSVQGGADDLVHALAIDEECLDGFFSERATSVLLRAGRLDEAAHVLRRAVRAAPPGANRDVLFATYADVEMARGPDHIEQARHAYEESMRSRGGNGKTKLGMALLLRRRGEEGWREFATDAANSMARQLLLTSELPETERAARAALLLEVEGDRVGAQNAWDQARSGPWEEMAAQASRALER